jgi:hypothetical protein
MGGRAAREPTVATVASVALHTRGDGLEAIRRPAVLSTKAKARLEARKRKPCTLPGIISVPSVGKYRKFAVFARPAPPQRWPREHWRASQAVRPQTAVTSFGSRQLAALFQVLG